ncbi:MAG: hypothetical protein K8R53_13910 [Bacteroidales bacterium]|nr:hypothetical protein [Bacteroidales bacterium]
MKKLFSLFIALIFLLPVIADEIVYSDSWGKHGVSTDLITPQEVVVNYSIHNFAMSPLVVEGEEMIEIGLPGIFLPNNEGAPNLPGTGRYIALPEGADAVLEILDYRVETYKNIAVAPSYRIPWDTETGPLTYSKDNNIYSKNSFYPENPFKLSEKSEMRGVDVVVLGVTPFQYNPVTQELKVYRDIKFRVTFSGGNGKYGEDRLRSRWWDPILSDALLNYSSLPKVDYSSRYTQSDATGCEYLIIIPNGADFAAWADSIKLFRNMQGILTNVVDLNDVGGNNATNIENYINDAYNTWDIPPAAILFMADYGTNQSNSIISPVYANYCISDHKYADVTGNHMADIVTARMTAQNASHLETMVKKFLDYERTPPTNQHFYDHPITAMGWQTERWFQVCSESINGFWEYSLGKEPVRENKIYQGTPGTI